MATASKAGAIYALIVFLIGFFFGTIRVLLIAPRLGETPAVLLETPIILAASWFVCRWCVDRVHVSRRFLTRTLMGVIAFVVLISAEFALGELVFERSLGDQVVGYGSPAGTIRLAAQLAFGPVPVVQVWWR